MPPEAVLLIGLQAAGKSSFYQERFFHTHVRINLDMLRTRRREALLVSACLEAGQPFVVDNTNVTAADRARYIGPAKQAGFTVIGYLFDPDVPGCLRRNRGRSGRRRVPGAAIHRTRARLEPPRPDEGFDRLHRVTLGAGGGFEVSPA
jgi:predicted kinase